MNQVTTKNGIVLKAIFIKTYGFGRLFLCQDRLMLTDLENIEVRSLDIIDFLLN